MNQPILVIMAAGMGSRYNGLKQLDSVGPANEVLMDYAIHDAMLAGFKRIILVVRHDFIDKCREITGLKWENKLELRYAYQELNDLPVKINNPERTKPWGTGQALLVCKELIDAPFAILNADDYYGRSTYKKIYEYLISNPPADQAVMMGFKLQNTLSPHGSVTRGICQVNSQNDVTGVEEITKITLTDKGIFYQKNGNESSFTGNEWASMNFWGFNPNIMNLINDEFITFLNKNQNDLKAEFLLPTAMNDLLAKSKIKLKLLESDAKWFGMTYQEDKIKVRAEIETLISKGFYPSKL